MKSNFSRISKDLCDVRINLKNQSLIATLSKRKIYKCLFVCLFKEAYSYSLTGIFCYGAYLQINLYHIQVHKYTWQRVLARKRVSRPVEEWSEAHF